MKATLALAHPKEAHSHKTRPSGAYQGSACSEKTVCLCAFSQREWSCSHRNSSPSIKWQPLLWAMRRSPRRLFPVAQTWQAASCRSTTQRRSFDFDTPWHSPQNTDKTTDTDNTCPAELGPPLVLKMGAGPILASPTT